jgi:hypothetical protein
MLSETTKQCGADQKCFQSGEKQWGHLGNILCANASEEIHDGKCRGICGATGEPVRWQKAGAKNE